MKIRRPVRNTTVWLSAVLVAAGSLAACTSSSGSKSTTKTDGASGPSSTITIAANSAPPSLDPAKTFNSSDDLISVDLAYDPLIYLNPDGTYKAGLATSWKYVDGINKFDMTLRTGAVFSDGTPFNASAVVDSIHHFQKANGPAAVYAQVIKSIVAVDATHVEVTFTDPYPAAEMLFSQRLLAGAIISPKAVADPSILTTHTDGVGPYVIDPSSTVTGDTYTYVPNPKYYDQPSIHFKKFVVKIIPDASTALNALKTGQVSFADGFPTTAAEATSAGLKVYSTLASWYGVAIFDRNGQIDKPLASQQVRQALNYATDRVGMTNALFGKFGSPSPEISLPAYESDGAYSPSANTRYPYDLKKAKELITQAGYPNGFSLEIGAVKDFGDADGVAEAQALAASWAKIGIKLKIITFPTVNQMQAQWFNAKLPMIICFYDGQPMAIEQGQALAPDAGVFNPFKTSDATLSALIKSATYASTADARTKAWQAVEDRVVELGWFDPVANGSDVYFASSSLKGIALSTTNFAPDPKLWYIG